MRRRKSSAREALEAVLFCAAVTALFAVLPFEEPVQAETGACCDSVAVSGSQAGPAPWPGARRMPTRARSDAGDAARRACELPESLHGQSALHPGEC
jgi:hypothetical protein